jgi:photosystem II stability/assembly factor-like uncharacterized protein
VKGPLDVTPGARGGPGEAEIVPEGKTFLRQREFLQQRGLSRQPITISIAGAGTRAVEEPAMYQRGAQQREEVLEEAPPSPAITWEPLGPDAIPHGQTYGSGPGSNPTMAGRITAIAVDPGRSEHILVGSAAGGVWETHDGGDTWSPRTDDQPTLSIGALAFDPSDSSRVYAGTGEGNSQYFHLGQGILVSSDGGATWTIVAGDVFADVGFYLLAVDPRDGQRLLVATTGGAAESGDGGASWSLLHRGATWDLSLAYLGDEPELLLAAPDGLFGARGGDAPVAVDLPGLGPLDADRERMAVAHVPSDPEQAYVFAATQGEARLWHRAAADAAYTPIDLPSFPVGDMVENVLDIGQASYDWHLSLPFTDDDTVYLGAIELVKGVRAGGHWDWSDISSRIGSGDSIHPDQHTMTFDPQDPDVIYAGNDGGVFRSQDRGDTWESLNAGLAISEVEYLSQRPDEPGWLLAGLQDNGTIRRENTNAWTQVGLGDGGDCATNMADPDVCFHSYYYMAMERSAERGDRDSWRRLRIPNDGRKLFYPPLEVNGEVVVKAGEIVFVSKDSGDSWEGIPLPQPDDGGYPAVASALAVPAAETILVGTIRGEVFRIRLENGRWSEAELVGRPVDGWISDLLCDPAVPVRHWVTFSAPGGVYRSDDHGASWSDVTANLPTIPVNAIVGDPAEPDRVWVACDVGVFESTDAGGTWSVFGTGLPNALAVDLLFYEADRLLRVGTRSRGVWEVAVG